MQIKNGIRNQLSRTVEGHIPAAVTFKRLDAAFSQLFRSNQDIRSPGIAPQRDHRRVLKEQQDVTDTAFFPHLYESLLQAQTRSVIYQPELHDRNHFASIYHALIASPYTLLDASSMASAR